MDRQEREQRNDPKTLLERRIQRLEEQQKKAQEIAPADIAGTMDAINQLQKTGGMTKEQVAAYRARVSALIRDDEYFNEQLREQQYNMRDLDKELRRERVTGDIKASDAYSKNDMEMGRGAYSKNDIEFERVK